VPWRVCDAALTFALGLGVAALFLVGAQEYYALQGGLQGAPAQPPAGLAITTTVLFYLGILAGLWLLVVRRRGVRWRDLGLAAPRPAWGLPVLLLILLFVIGSTLILVTATLVVELLGSSTSIVIQDSIPPGGSIPIATAVLTSLLLAPFAEELFFRGVLYQALRQRTGAVLATTGSALLFTLVHARSTMAPEALLLGVVLTMMFERTNSLYPSICMHMLYNGAVLLLAHGAGRLT
jgi:membrane protease YdiL (CAAX protease family)